MEAGLARRERAPCGDGSACDSVPGRCGAQADPRIRDYAHPGQRTGDLLSTTSPDPQADARTAGLTWGSSMVEGREPQTRDKPAAKWLLCSPILGSIRRRTPVPRRSRCVVVRFWMWPEPTRTSCARCTSGWFRER